MAAATLSEISRAHDINTRGMCYSSGGRYTFGLHQKLNKSAAVIWDKGIRRAAQHQPTRSRKPSKQRRCKSTLAHWHSAEAYRGVVFTWARYALVWVTWGGGRLREMKKKLIQHSWAEHWVRSLSVEANMRQTEVNRDSIMLEHIAKAPNTDISTDAWLLAELRMSQKRIRLVKSSKMNQPQGKEG